MTTQPIDALQLACPLACVSENQEALRSFLALLSAAEPEEAQLAHLLQCINPLLLTAEDIVGAVQQLGSRPFTTHAKARPCAIDLCGTGGDQKSTPNISTLAALTVAACGVLVAKYGGRSVSGKMGSADIVLALGIPYVFSPGFTAQKLSKLRFGFYFAPTFLPVLLRVSHIRKFIRRPTVLNVLLPLLNPSRPAFQLVGVYDPALLRPVALALQQLAIQRALVVHGEGGYDEMTTTGVTQCIEVTPSSVTEYTTTPEDCGIARAEALELHCEKPEQCLTAAMVTIAGVPTPVTNMVAYNAGHALYIAGRVTSAKEGVRDALSALRDGRVLQLVSALRSVRYPDKRMSPR